MREHGCQLQAESQNVSVQARSFVCMAFRSLSISSSISSRLCVSQRLELAYRRSMLQMQLGISAAAQQPL